MEQQIFACIAYNNAKQILTSHLSHAFVWHIILLRNNNVRKKFIHFFNFILHQLEPSSLYTILNC